VLAQKTVNDVVALNTYFLFGGIKRKDKKKVRQVQGAAPAVVFFSF
jgi:hypothetical protein